jgi:hypothetical protein
MCAFCFNIGGNNGPLMKNLGDLGRRLRNNEILEELTPERG